MSGITINLESLAMSVLIADQFNEKSSGEQIAHILEIALKTKLGVMCLANKSIDINLGNGHVLHCTVEVESEYQKLLKRAEEKGWKTPQNKSIPEAAWVNYWMACEEHERDPDAGRPVVPHRSA